MIWTAVLAGAAGCYALKLAGVSVPHRLLEGARTQHVALLLPVALLGALVAIQTFTAGHRLALDARAAGLIIAVLAVRQRAPFLLVVGLAAGTTALIRLL